MKKRRLEIQMNEKYRQGTAICDTEVKIDAGYMNAIWTKVCKLN